MHPVQTAGETGTGNATESKIQQHTKGKGWQSYLLESIFLSTLNGQTTGWDGNTGSWPSLVVAVLWLFTNTRKLILAVFAILMMREAPQMTEFCELQSKDWYTVTKNKKTKEEADKTCSVHLLATSSLVFNYACHCLTGCWGSFHHSLFWKVI